ncbi:MAG: cupin domain-containing protein [Planctomycetes bacterium]|nr:cupin domain-containing protein [Planctomycetota bacterium]
MGRYEGFVTHLLVGELNSGSKEISIQITEVESGGEQFLHSHRQDQCYYVVRGVGRVTIDQEVDDIKEGDGVFIRSGATHGIKNLGEEVLVYLTANQAFGREKEGQLWGD